MGFLNICYEKLPKLHPFIWVVPGIFFANFLPGIAYSEITFRSASEIARDAQEHARKQVPIVFKLEDYKGKPLLKTEVNKRNIVAPAVDWATIYLSCFPGRIDHFRLNVILSGFNVQYLQRRDPFFLGVGYQSSNTIPFAVRSIESEILPRQYEFQDQLEAISEVVISYDPIRVGGPKIYLTTFPEADFFQSLSDTNSISLVAYSQDDEMFFTIFHVNFEFSSDLKSAFINECLKQ